jgi:hypothetical protein
MGGAAGGGACPCPPGNPWPGAGPPPPFAGAPMAPGDGPDAAGSCCICGGCCWGCCCRPRRPEPACLAGAPPPPPLAAPPMAPEDGSEGSGKDDGWAGPPGKSWAGWAWPGAGPPPPLAGAPMSPEVDMDGSPGVAGHGAALSGWTGAPFAPPLWAAPDVFFLGAASSGSARPAMARTAAASSDAGSAALLHVLTRAVLFMKGPLCPAPRGAQTRRFSRPTPYPGPVSAIRAGPAADAERSVGSRAGTKKDCGSG